MPLTVLLIFVTFVLSVVNSSEVFVAVDPISLEIIRCALKAAANGMSAVLKKTAYNMMIYEVQTYRQSYLGKDEGDKGQ